MIIVDTSVWIDHLRARDPLLITLLSEGRARMHPFVLGELALGNLPDRSTTLKLLGRVQSVDVAASREVLHLVNVESLLGLGIGYVDVHLLASARLMPSAKVWTHDRRLAAASDRMSLSFRALH